MGPLELVAIEFPGTRFRGEIMATLAAPVESGALRVVDVTFLSKDTLGAVTSYELAELDEHDATPFDVVDTIMGLVSVVDLEAIGARLPNNSSAAVLVLEHAWAADLQRAIDGANGRIVAQERIADEIARAALAVAEATE